MLKRIFSYFKSRFFYIWLFFFSFLSMLIVPDRANAIGLFTIYFFYCGLFLLNRRFFAYTLFFVSLFPLLYYPVSLHYSDLNSGVVAAFFETNVEESFAFLKNFSLEDFYFPIFYAICLYFTLRLAYAQPKPQDTSPKETKNRKILMGILLLGGVLGSIALPIKYYFEHKNDPLDVQTLAPAWSLTYSNNNILRFYANLVDSTKNYFSDKKALEEASKIKDPWVITSVKPKYQNYVLIIGESARRDYHHVFGFPLDDTPFLDRTKGYFNSAYISAAPATYHSLIKTLYQERAINGHLSYAYNIITLAKAAGYKTIWMSNQGSIGRFDTVASRLGAMANQKYFTHKGGYNTENISDLQLLPYFKNALEKHTKDSKPRIFIFHLMGSHPDFCSRLNSDKEKIFHFKNRNLSCYVDTIHLTDHFIEQVVDLLKAQHQSYSLIYFSDHGLANSYSANAVADVDNVATVSLPHYVSLSASQQKDSSMVHNGKFKQDYQVPFIKLSSDDTAHTMVHVPRSAHHFIQGFAEWLGISTPDLDQNYHFWSDIPDKNIEVFNLEKNVPYDTLLNDPYPGEKTPTSTKK